MPLMPAANQGQTRAPPDRPPQHDGGDDGHEAGAAEEGERIGHLVGVETGVQFGDDHPDYDGPRMPVSMELMPRMDFTP